MSQCRQVLWNGAGTDPGEPGWYRVRIFDEPHKPEMIRAWGENEMWWIPLKDGWITGPLGKYEWIGPISPFEPENPLVSPLDEMNTARAALGDKP